ncbi:CS1-pili formation C-terminal domain-containing protein [Aeromonas allosaccharophila]|uniref:CS1-pili formation C-terminal domain-containing protein n=1 Tax=Aeromonas allosaccharophila TaxID=656 RepID=A0ABZ0FDI4_9GAMM|nr:CS1-pili formation C-terminal domain-containing protein [Aeromonas allosaccharophila]WOE67661.1 CS1-pili formation C-terminal domain-containing protein [Aeromonas allosaccharophila]
MTRSLLLLLGLLLSAPLAAADPVLLLQQARQLPEGFEEHFFGVPLMVRVTVDGRLLGDGEVLLGRDNSVQLLSLQDVQESEFDERERERWLSKLGIPLPLGECVHACPEGIVGLQYSLEASQLSVLTGQVEQGARDQRFMALPQESKGLLVQNQLNLVQGSQRHGHYNLQLEGSWGQWSPFMEGDATWQEGQSSEVGLAQLYGERLHEANFYRLGFFFPSAQGLVRQPNYYSGVTPTVLGVMWGSSDLLRRERGVPSLAPIQVAPARPGMVEIYRDGNLIQSQPVVSGLQALDTRSLPGGIYEVELRLLEDGQETRRWREMIYKPSNWQTPEEPWRFNLFAGRQTRWLARQGDSDLEGASGGAAINHLLLPSLVVGAGSQYVDRRAQHSLSLDWEATSQLHGFASLNQSVGMGWGYDLQGIYWHGNSSLVASHSRNLRKQGDASSVSSLSLQQSLEKWGSLGVYVSHQSGRGNGADLGWHYSDRFLGRWVTWGVTLFDRPGSESTAQQRDRGSTLSLTVNLGGHDRQLSLGLGSNTSRSGGAQRSAYLNYQQEVDWGPLRQVSVGSTHDSYGTGLSGYGRFAAPWLGGDLFAQHSSYNEQVTGGINLESVVALGQAGELALGSRDMGGMGNEAAMILDIEADDEAARIRVSDDQGSVQTLGPGRHLVSVPALQSGTLQLEMADHEGAPLTIKPTVLPYHLNRGGVGYGQVNVMSTVTVIGRLLNKEGKPLKGAVVRNHIGRTISENDGFFVMEMSKKNPRLQVEHDGRLQCQMLLNQDDKKWRQDTLFLGDLVCHEQLLARK